MKPTLALVGDHSAEVIAHRAIPRALELACAATKCDCTWQWVATRDVRNAPRDLGKFSAVWLVPASPYANMAGALSAIRFARETKRPFLGTCGGFQHALIEFARNVAGLAAADHVETSPTASTLVVTRLSCSLVEQTRALRFVPGSIIRAAYGHDLTNEGYRCNYGPAPEHRAAFERAGLRFTAFDDQGEVRAGELPVTVHPFFVGTLFQPERAALHDETPPLVAAFVHAAHSNSER